MRVARVVMVASTIEGAGTRFDPVDKHIRAHAGNMG